MSLYNMVHGMNPSVFLILPLLGKKPDDFPRFRDCFLEDEEHPEYRDHILVYTRVGGPNREDYEDEIATIEAMPTFVGSYDDSYDNTYATFVFSPPEEWREDFDTLRSDGPAACSERYKRMILDTFSSFSEEGKKKLLTLLGAGL